MQKQIAVIGLGKFGTNLCIELARQGAQVLAVDKEESLVRKLSEIVSQAVIADTTDEDVVGELNLSTFDDVVICIGSDIRASILITIILKEAGIKNLWTKAKDSLHVKALKKIGSDHIINPERDMAIRLSEELLTDNLIDFVHLRDNISIYELFVTERYAGTPVANLKLDKDIQLLALKRGAELIKNPIEGDTLLIDDVLILGGQKQKLQLYVSRL